MEKRESSCTVGGKANWYSHYSFKQLGIKLPCDPTIPPMNIYSKEKNFNNKSFQRRQWHPTPVLLPGKSHGRRSLESCSPWGCWGSDTTERLHFHFSLSCVGEGNGNPLQCSCRENPRDGGVWWAAIYGVAQSRTRLKRPSSSSKYITGGAKVNTFCSQKNLLKKKISRAWYHLKHVSSFNSLKVEQWPVSLFPDLLPCNKG